MMGAAKELGGGVGAEGETQGNKNGINSEQDQHMSFFFLAYFLSFFFFSVTSTRTYVCDAVYALYEYHAFAA